MSQKKNTTSTKLDDSGKKKLLDKMNSGGFGKTISYDEYVRLKKDQSSSSK